VPQPVPISTTAFAPMAAAKNLSVAPPAGPIGTAPPTSAAFRRAASRASSSATNCSA
jgi:hypothetical protein